MSRLPLSVRGAVLASLTRPHPWVLGFLAAWVVGTSGDLLATLLAATTGFLGGVVGTLVATPEDRLLPPGNEALEALPPGLAAGGEPVGRPLPEPLRGRYQDLHKQVEAMLATWPGVESSRYLDKEALAKAPERFRSLAKRLAASHPTDPGRPALTERLDRIQEQVVRLQSHWIALAGLAEDEGGLEAELEATADDLEALEELQAELDTK